MPSAAAPSFPRSPPNGPPQLSRLLTASDKFINKNSQRRGARTEDGGKSQGTCANFQPLGQGGPDLTETVPSVLWALPSDLGNQAAGGEGGARQAWATQASVHVPGNMASKSQLTTLGCYGRKPSLYFFVVKAPSRVAQTTSIRWGSAEGKSHLRYDHIKKRA